MRLTNIKKQKKKYKALIVDVDGTLIPNKRDGMPSKRVTNAIAKASKLIHIGVATSRPYFVLAHIVDHLKLSGPSIINGGAQIINSSNGIVLWEKILNQQDIKVIHAIAKTMKISFRVNDCGKDMQFTKNYTPKKPLLIWIYALNSVTADDFIKKASHLSTVAIHKLPSWSNGKIDLVITHTVATKQHAIFEIAKILNIETHEIIGVGDGYNDFPLLMACGLKVAMGNAVDELKAIADYVAPSVEEDGVVDVIEKFVL